jgi:hypothetical protein
LVAQGLKSAQKGFRNVDHKASVAGFPEDELEVRRCDWGDKAMLTKSLRQDTRLADSLECVQAFLRSHAPSEVFDLKPTSKRSGAGLHCGSGVETILENADGVQPAEYGWTSPSSDPIE